MPAVDPCLTTHNYQTFSCLSSPCIWLKRIVACCFPKSGYVEACAPCVAQVATKVTTWVSRMRHAFCGFLAAPKKITPPLLSYSFSIPHNDEKHFRIDDIQRMANKAIGLRHVSSEEAATHELSNGVAFGCSFNLTFKQSEHGDIGFSRLPEELADPALSQEAKSKTLTKYEAAVDGHIMQSLVMDLGPRIDLGRTTVGEVIDGLSQTYFLMIDYSNDYRPTDFSQYGNLGRFPKRSIKPERIKHMLSPNWLAPDIVKMDRSKILMTTVESDRLFNKIIEATRVKLLELVRSSSFDNDFADDFLRNSLITSPF